MPSWIIIITTCVISVSKDDRNYKYISCFPQDILRLFLSYLFFLMIHGLWHAVWFWRDHISRLMHLCSAPAGSLWRKYTWYNLTVSCHIMYSGTSQHNICRWACCPVCNMVYVMKRQFSSTRAWYSTGNHWNGKVVMLTTFSSLAALQVVMTTISDAGTGSDETFFQRENLSVSVMVSKILTIDAPWLTLAMWCFLWVQGMIASWKCDC